MIKKQGTPWLFEGEEVTDEDIKGYEGFVYLITNLVTGYRYIGRKYFTSKRKKSGASRRSTTESDWRKYYGSSSFLIDEIEEYGIENFQREILSMHKTRGDCNREEVKQQFVYDVLEQDGWYNENISGKWRKTPKHIIEGRKYSRRLL